MPVLTNAALDEELAFAQELALRVGERALEMQREGREALGTYEKPNDGGPVTNADLEANSAIVTAISERFPDDGILAEESVNDPSVRDRERVWMIDPIDGTREFSEGQDAWAVHIGLAVNGRPTLGVVARPAQSRLLWGVVGEPNAWRRDGSDTAIALAPPQQLEPAPRIVASASRYSRRVGALSDALGIDEDHRMRSGSCGVKFSLLSIGRAHIYAHGSGGLSLWDTCAPTAILIAAGGTVTDLLGGPLDHGPAAKRHARGLLASRGVDHEAIVEQVRRIGGDWFDDGGLKREGSD